MFHNSLNNKLYILHIWILPLNFVNKKHVSTLGYYLLDSCHLLLDKQSAHVLKYVKFILYGSFFPTSPARQICIYTVVTFMFHITVYN